jgi:4-hydroxy-2-oxoheptanedioate aldolase
VRSAEFSNISGVKYLKGNSENLITIIQIESIDGINNLSKILDNNLVDVVFFGPYDLSQSLGIPGKTKNTKVIEAIDNGIKIAQKHNVSSGIFCDNDEDREFWSSKGMDYIIFKIDVQIILDSFKTLYGKEIS